MRKFNCYVAYELDDFNLPVCVADSLQELSDFLGCSVAYLSKCLSLGDYCCGFEVRGYALV